MRKVTICLLLASLFAVLSTLYAQQMPSEGAVFRVSQLVYPNADVLVDGESVLVELGYTLTSDYLPLAAGSHTLSVVPTGQSAGATAEIEFAEGHRYTIAPIGTYDAPDASLLVVDETAELMALPENSGSYAIILHNVAQAPAVDVYFNETQVGADMGFGGYVFTSPPIGMIDSHATLAGNPERWFLKAPIHHA